MSAFDWEDALSRALASRHDHNTLRIRRPVKVLDACHVEIDGQRLVNFASNNYLGLTHHPRVIAAFQSAVQMYGTGSGAAALITGHSELHASAERAIAAWKGTESAVLLGSGYVANLAAVQMLSAVSGGHVRFLVDKLCHASLIDAVQSVDGSFRVFPHNQLEKLRRLLQEADANTLQVVVTESIFSMDGDAADLQGIANLKDEFSFLLLLDEAHGSGVYGPNGSGYAAELGLAAAVNLTIVTFSKAIGCVGGAVCASQSLCESIVNFGRPYIFSTSLPPAIPAAIEEAINVMRDEPQRQQRVRELSKRVRKNGSDSPIIPVVIGDEIAALTTAERFNNKGMFTVAVRPPTVPRGTSRLRVTISCGHSDAEIQKLIDALEGEH